MCGYRSVHYFYTSSCHRKKEEDRREKEEEGRKEEIGKKRRDGENKRKQLTSMEQSLTITSMVWYLPTFQP